MDEGTQTTTVAPDTTAGPTAPITFHGRKIETYLPNEAQMAVIARMTFIDPETKDINRVRTHINRVGALIAGLMVKQADWDFVEDAMAAREVTWDDVLGIFGKIAEAHGLVNREQRRAAGKKQGGKRARRG